MKLDTSARYRSSHEFAKKEGSLIVAGISDHAQESLGDIVESVKAASDLYMPVSGRIVAVNEALQGDPALVNRDCYGGGWMVKIEPSKAGEWDGLMDAAAYEKASGKE